MHTVIITDPAIEKEFSTYRNLYAPFLTERGGSVCLCAWKKSGKDIKTVVPDLYDAVRGYTEWRAIILLHSPDREQLKDPNNPFDFKKNNTEELSIEENEEDLVRLTHMLAGYPSLGVKEYKTGYVTYDKKTKQYKDCLYENKPILLENIEKEKYDRFEEDKKKYIEECGKRNERQSRDKLLEIGRNIKDEIREKYRNILNEFGNYKEKLIEISYTEEEKEKHKVLVEKYAFKENRPVEVLILSIREEQIEIDDHHETLEETRRAWQFFDEIESSDFWKVYPSSCRFICYDLINREHTLRNCEYWKFFLLVLALANNQVPNHALQAYYVYQADLQIDTDELSRIYSRYIESLMSFLEIIQIRMTLIPDLTQEKNKELVPEQKISVHFGNIDEGKVKTKTDKFGLSTDCPASEAQIWHDHIKKSRQTVENILFTPQEVVAERAIETRQKIDDFVNKEQVLDRFQIIRISKRIDELEPNIINTKLFKMLDTDMYKAEVEKAGDEVQDHIKIRLTKRNAIIISLVCFTVYLCGFIPYLINSAKESFTVLGLAFALVFISIGLLAGFGLFTLWNLKQKLIKVMKKYNDKITDIFERVKESAKVFSEYFSNVCTYMYARSLLTGITNKKDSDYSSMRKLERHFEYLQNEIEECKELCSLYGVPINISSAHSSSDNITDKLLEETPEESQFYEISPCMEAGTMRLTSSPNMKHVRKVLTNNKNDQWDKYDTGETLNAPYSFITGINIVREEIYRKEGA